MKRTIALKMVLLLPGVLALLLLFVCSQAPFSTLHLNGIQGEWMALERINLTIWAFLMMPLYVTLQTALVAGLDHSENPWKSLLTRPVPRWTVYLAKLIVVSGLTAAATVALVGGILADGAILPHLNRELLFGPPVPWRTIFGQSMQITGLMFVGLTIQHWVSLRWRAFSVAIGTGIVAIVVAFFASEIAHQPEMGGWPQYFPWSLPMLVFAKQHGNLGATLLVCTVAGLMCTAAGCLEFSRREIQ
jgi:lantibiotic transport system permease protein